MLGYTQPNNDIYIFFENDEIERLERGRVQGTFFNFKNPSVTCLLEASVNDEIGMNIVKVSGHKNDEGFMTWLRLEMRSMEYQTLRKRRSSELHEGFRHICLKDSNDLDLSDQMNYKQLKYWESQYSQQET